MNKKGYIRTIEAIIAVVIVFMFLVTIVVRDNRAEPDVPKDIRLFQEIVLNEMENNKVYRDEILNCNPIPPETEGCDEEAGLTNAIDFIENPGEGIIAKTEKPVGYKISVNGITDTTLDTTLPAEAEGKTVYARTLILGTNSEFTSDDSKLVMFYLWYE